MHAVPVRSTLAAQAGPRIPHAPATFGAEVRR